MCQTKINDLSDPHYGIVSAVMSVTLEIQKITWTEVEYWFDVCCPAKRGTCQDLLT